MSADEITETSTHYSRRIRQKDYREAAQRNGHKHTAVSAAPIRSVLIHKHHNLETSQPPGATFVQQSLVFPSPSAHTRRNSAQAEFNDSARTAMPPTPKNSLS